MRTGVETLLLFSAGNLLACSPVPYATTNSAKMTEAAAFAGAAAVAQVVKSAAEAQARNRAPITRAAGFYAMPSCDNEGQYACVSVAHRSNDPSRSEPDHEMTEDEARDYVLAYVNGVRKLNDRDPVAADANVRAFAQAGSERLAIDHLPDGDAKDHEEELGSEHAELQGSPEGSLDGSLQERIGEILVHWMNEPRDGTHRAALTSPLWHKMGVGIAHRDGRMYFTIDFTR